MLNAKKEKKKKRKERKEKKRKENPQQKHACYLAAGNSQLAGSEFWDKSPAALPFSSSPQKKQAVKQTVRTGRKEIDLAILFQ